MSADIERWGKVAVIKTGNLDHKTAPGILDQIQVEIKSGVRHVIFDLSRAEILDGDGMYVILRTAVLLQRVHRDNEVRIFNPTPAVENVLKLRRVYRRLVRTGDMNKAVQSLSRAT